MQSLKSRTGRCLFPIDFIKMAAMLLDSVNLATDVEVDMSTPKPVEEYRNYKDSFRHSIVENHYRLMRENQTVEFVDQMLEKYSFQHPRQNLTIREAFKFLETYVDCSDPDVR